MTQQGTQHLLDIGRRLGVFELGDAIVDVTSGGMEASRQPGTLERRGDFVHLAGESPGLGRDAPDAPGGLFGEDRVVALPLAFQLLANAQTLSRGQDGAQQGGGALSVGREAHLEG